MWTNNHKLQISLEQYQSLQIQSGYDLPTDFENRYLRGDLTGTHISSNKPIAVFSGNGRVNTKPSRSRVSLYIHVYTDKTINILKITHLIIKKHSSTGCES